MDLSAKFRLALILGGTRCGKSRYGLSLALKLPQPRLFVATCEPGDPEMAARIENHQKERGPEWDTEEAPLRLVPTLAAAENRYGVVLVDCLTLWLSNVMLQPGATEAKIRFDAESLLQTLTKVSCPTILISNEVGWGIVPDNPLARQFRDWAGWLHQRLAQAADLVVLVVAGLPLPLKSGDFGGGRDSR
jgi:adenosylcobinamide kinase / adenosylcobinamide-phosphate guanylyltransferase